jgi:hypothetical protein
MEQMTGMPVGRPRENDGEADRFSSLGNESQPRNAGQDGSQTGKDEGQSERINQIWPSGNEIHN